MSVFSSLRIIPILSTVVLAISSIRPASAFVPSGVNRHHIQQLQLQQQQQSASSTISSTCSQRARLSLAYFDEGAPSDYDSEDLTKKKEVEVDTDEEDAAIRDELKRELLLLSSVTNRGDCASKDEQNILIDLVNQLEALNPTPNPAGQCEGDWSLCLSSTALFRSSPFFQSIRAAAGDANKQIANNGFELHDRATTGSRIGRVRQTIGDGKLVSEVELEVGVPGLPFRLKGTVVTTASLKVASAETWELEVANTQVIGSNVPLLNQFLEESKIELPVGELYKTVQGKVPVVKMKTYYVDEGIRITRDVDDNFFVFSRA